MAAPIRQRLLAFALVGQGLGSQRDPIVALAPFLSPIANDFDGQPFDPATFRSEMRTRFGIALSRDVTEVFSSRLASMRLLRPASRGYTWTKSGVEPRDAAEADARHIDKLISSAKLFFDQRRDLFQGPFDEDTFLTALTRVILSRQTAVRSAIAAVESSAQAEAQNAPDVNQADLDYTASEFISWIRTEDKESFRWAAELAGAALVAESLIEIRTPSAGQHIRPDLTVYLDGPLAMELLGCSGRPQLEDTRYIVNALRSQGVAISILSHSVSELKDNLRGVLGRMPNERRGPTATALLRNEVEETYLRSVLHTPEYFLEEQRVQVLDVRALAQTADPKYFSQENEHGFFAAIQGQYDNPLAAERDASSISWVIRRRKAHTDKDVLKSKHVLLTRNALLYQRVRSYRSQLGLNVSDFAAPVILARDMAGIIWLILGQQERVELSSRELLLQSQRARANTPQVVDEMFRQLKAVNEDNAELFWAAVRNRDTSLMR